MSEALKTDMEVCKSMCFTLRSSGKLLLLLKLLSLIFILALNLTFGGMGLLPQSRGGACFCTRGARQGYDVVLFIVALAKTVTPGGSAPWERGQRAGFCPAALAAKPGR